MSDKNANSASDMSEQERKEAFNRMLEEYEISSKMKWHEVEKIIKDDWRFGLCRNNGIELGIIYAERKQFLSEYQSRRVKFEQTEGRHREMAAKKEFREQLEQWLNAQKEEEAEAQKKEAEVVNTEVPSIIDVAKKPEEDSSAALMEDGSPLTFENVTFRDLAYAWRKKDFWKFAHEDDLDHIFQDFMDENENKMRDISRRDRIRKMDKLFLVYSKHPQVNRLTKWNDVCHFMAEKFPEEFRSVEPLDRLAVWERWIKEADEKFKVEREKAKRRAERKHRDKFREMLVHDYMEQIHNGVSWFDLHKDIKDREAYIDLIGSRNSSQPYDIFNDICKEVRREARQKRAQLDYQSGHIWDFDYLTQDAEVNHAVEIAGWGQEADGTPYWVARFSYGSAWGDHGWAKLQRSPTGLIENSGCVWATVNPAAWKDWSLYPDTKYVPPATAPIGKQEYVDSINTVNGPTPIAGKAQEQQVVKDPKPQDMDYYAGSSNRAGGYKVPLIENRCSTYSMVCSMDPTCQCDPGYYKTYDARSEDNGKCYLCVPRVAGKQIPDDGEKLPESWDWRNVNGKNYITFNRNQHNPEYCGGCWAFAVTSAFADRLSIGAGARWPNKAISPQQVINCRGGGDCYGGEKIGVYDFFFGFGAVHDTCHNYAAKNYKDFSEWCPAQARCLECAEGGKCRPTRHYRTWFATDYARLLNGTDQIKREIWKRGPVSCGVDATKQMDDYTGGVFYQNKAEPKINHEVGLVGWGREEGTNDEYWIMRNSWGTFWGENGFMRIKFGNLKIDSDCSWVEPSKDIAGKIVPNAPFTIGDASTGWTAATYFEDDYWKNAPDYHAVPENLDQSVVTV
ncbi:cathepsin z, putative [Perkinsus marinus ATCC 50983]|uniref:Cathepsin z, putative n=1 Tax=Perkinsus marinus (strain ATCC 50983 / TXsc) TaxID=423536 RepID=C5LNV7_PERM5|nr:cathepsin z, putative [Perkinsus marinus ATCC 50983]EER01539.1 cathepsin z, putative [Perkinsus marinus ATCC 50983]|eukprot:XP_002768821.1 cathepsin z, putative [Perkinsus marinus ATCC 50983]